MGAAVRILERRQEAVRAEIDAAAWSMKVDAWRAAR